nr:hypothetical protein [uncultured Pseudomonas sp.]
MSPKPPTRGTVTVEIHARPGEPAGGSAPRRDTTTPVDSSPATAIAAPRVVRPGRTPAAVDLDAIQPVPAITIQPTPAPLPAAVSGPMPLTHYRISTDAHLPPANEQGLRTYKGRQYVDVPGGTVQVAAIAENGPYRARLASELSPSGPVLVRAADGKLWHPAVEAAAEMLYPLTEARLQGFLTDLDFTDVEPDSHGLHSFDGKRYAVIERRAYQVLHDPEASTAQISVMRIVRPDDAVAADGDNRFIATRPGRSEPIVFDEQHGWRGIVIAGAGGMRRSKPDKVQRLTAADLILELQTQTELIHQGATRIDDLDAAWRVVKGTELEKGALVQLEVQLHRQLAALEQAANFYINERDTLQPLKGSALYAGDLHNIQKKRIEAYTRLMSAGDSRKRLDISFYNDPFEAYRSTVNYLKSKLALLEKRQQIALDILKRTRASESELIDIGFYPTEIHETKAFWVDAKSRLLTDVPITDNNFKPIHLAYAFTETTFAFRDIDSIPVAARIAVLSNLVDQCAAIRASYEDLELPPGPVHASSRQEIIDAIQAFENTLENRIAVDHRDLERTTSLPSQDQSIDFDFIPAQRKNQPAPQAKRMFRSKHHGVYKIRVGQTRRNALGEELIDVMDPHNPAKVMQTYERREGEWQRLVATQERNLSTLITQAGVHLEQTETHLNTARKDERAKRNATNIVEQLGDAAEALDDLGRQIERAPNPAKNDIAVLVQRLRQDSERLRREGEDIRIRLYKDKSFLSADRVAYLISQDHLSVSKIQVRLEQGRGKYKHFIDIYSLNDRHTGEPLWQAHFHYEKRNSAALDFMVKGGHLKTLAQSATGSNSQRRDEQAGRPHVAIWRETLDGRTAQKIFELAP